MTKRTVQTAAQRLKAIDAELVEIRQEIEWLGEEFQTAVAADRDKEADRIESRIAEEEGKIKRLEIKREALLVAAEEEAERQREAEGVRFAEQANARYAEIVADFARAQELAAELTEIVGRNDNFALADWASTARKAHDRGAAVQRTLPEARELHEAFVGGAKRLASARDYAARMVIESSSPRSAPAQPISMSEIWERSKAAGIA